MATSPDAAGSSPASNGALRRRLDAGVARSPEVAYIAPFMSFLRRMAVGNWIFPCRAGLTYSYALRTFGALAVALAFWRYWPPLGRLHLPSAVVFGLLTAVSWVGVDKWFAGQGRSTPTQTLGP